MDDLGNPVDVFVENFSCTQQDHSSLPTETHPVVHRNLIAASSRFGYSFVAVASQILVFKHADLHIDAARPVATVNVDSFPVKNFLSLSLILGDEVLLCHAATTSANTVLLLSTPALVIGDVVSLPAPTLNPREVALRETFGGPVQSQLIALLLDSEVHVVKATPQGTTPVSKFEVANAVCVALSPDDELLAVSLQRGSVGIYQASTGTLLSTIVEVESGWIPFALHFVARRSLLVPYASETGDGMGYSYIVWEISREGNAIIRPCPLSELCLPSNFMGDDDTKVTPILTCCTIPEWDIGIVGSSLSCDIELIGKADDGWQKWTLDEGKTPILPTDEEYEDTMVLGMAIDFNDTSTFPPLDASSPPVNAMPRLLVYTSGNILLPFSLIDYSAGAKCQLIRDQVALPPVPEVPQELIQEVEKPHEPEPEPEPEQGTTTEATVTTSGNVSEIPITNGTSIIDSFPDFDPEINEDSLSLDGLNISPLIKASKLAAAKAKSAETRDTSEKVSVADNVSHKSEPSATSIGLPSSVSTEEPKEAVSTAVTKKLPHFDNAEEFLSKFDFKDQPSSFLPPKVEATAPTRSLLQAPPPSQPSAKSTAFFDNAKNMAVEIKWAISGSGNALQGVPTTVNEQPQVLPKPEPEAPRRRDIQVSLETSLNRAEEAAKSEDPMDMLRSILEEMTGELNTCIKANDYTKQELNAQSHELMQSLRATRQNLSELLESARTKFRNEKALREEVSKTLSRVLTLSREYETLALEFHVQESDGFSRSLGDEEKEMDNRIAAKESEVSRSIAGIEEKIDSDINFRSKKLNSSEVMQEIYNSLSMQGVRISRVRGLLEELEQAVDKHDMGGRQSDLGLSLARLERLALTDTKPSSEKLNDSGTRNSRRRVSLSAKKVLDDSDEDVEPTENEEQAPADETQLLSPEIRGVLRKLAMRNGREKIVAPDPSASFRRHRTTSSDQGSRSLPEAAKSEIIPVTMNQSNNISSPNPAVSFANPKTFPQIPNARDAAFSSQTRSSTFASPKSDVRTTKLPSSSTLPKPSGIGISINSSAFQSGYKPVLPKSDGPFNLSEEEKNPRGKEISTSSEQKDKHLTLDRVVKGQSFGVPSGPSPFNVVQNFGKGFTGTSNEAKLSTTAEQSQCRAAEANSTSVTAPAAVVAPESAKSKFTGRTPSQPVVKEDAKEDKLYAALPPDSDEDDEPIRVSLAAVLPSAQKKEAVSNVAPTLASSSAMATPSLFGSASSTSLDHSSKTPFTTSVDAKLTVPPTVSVDDKKLEKENNDLTNAAPAVSSEKETVAKDAEPTPSFGKTNDLFAALPPDDDDEPPPVPAAVQLARAKAKPNNEPEKNPVQSQSTTQSISIFGSGGFGSVGDSSQASQFSSLFGAAQSSTTFGTPFGASSSSAAFETNSSNTDNRRKTGNDTSSDESDEENRENRSMESTSMFGNSQSASSGSGFGFSSQNSFGTPSQGFGNGPVTSFGSFGQSNGGQTQSQSGFGMLAQQQSTSSGGFQAAQAAFGQSSGLGVQGGQGAFGSQSGFGAASSHSGFGAQAVFGSQSAFGAQTNVASQSGFANQNPFGNQGGFGTPPAFGQQSVIGGNATFGTPSQLGGGQSPFAAAGNNGSASGFGASPSVKFGQSSAFGNAGGFGNTGSFGTGFGGGRPSGQSPFGAITSANSFGGSSQGASGFAEMANANNSNSASGFGQLSNNSGFGNNNDAFKFSSPSFTERRV